MVRVPLNRLGPLAAWLEATMRLPSGVTAESGRITLYPYQRGAARVGYTTHGTLRHNRVMISVT
jgi:hypothetical protein